MQVTVQNLIVSAWSLLSKSLLLRAVESGDLVKLPIHDIVFTHFLFSKYIFGDLLGARHFHATGGIQY